MKRWIFSFLVFPITLVIGLIAFRVIDPKETQIEIFTVQVPTLAAQFSDAPAFTPASEPNNVNSFSESFADDSHIGRRGKNKVEIQCYDPGNGMIAEVRFFSRHRNGAWEQKQLFEFEKDNLVGCDPKVEDFNNDGLKDVTYQSSVAARGANEIRTLFIYDKEKDSLIHIKNSEDYPNLAYNKKLKCIDAWLFHGATTTVFLKLEGNTLRQFAAVDTGLELTVSVTGQDGKRRVVSRKKMSQDDIYTRFSTFNPPRPDFSADHPRR